MKPEEHMIDSLLRERERVPGEHDEPFLQELERRLDDGENPDIIPIDNPPPEIDRIKPLPTWIAAAAVACIVAAIGMSVYFTKKEEQLPIATNTKADPQPNEETKNKVNSNGYGNPGDAGTYRRISEHPPQHTDKGDFPNRGQSNGRLSLKRNPTSNAATNNANQTNLEHHLPQYHNSSKNDAKATSWENLLATEDLNTIKAQLGGNDPYKTKLAASLITLYQQKDAPLPEAAKKLSKDEIEELHLAFTILKTESEKWMRRTNAAHPNRFNKHSDLTKQIAALNTFNKIFQSTENGKNGVEGISGFGAGSQMAEQASRIASNSGRDNQLDFSSTLLRWKKELENRGGGILPPRQNQ